MGLAINRNNKRSLFLLAIEVSSQEGGPVGQVEGGEDDGKGDFADQLKLKKHKTIILLQFIFTDLFPLSFPTRSEEDGDDDELKDATEDEEHADEHPDVKEGDVRDTRNILPNLESVDECQIFLSQCSYRAKHGGKGK